MIGELSFCKSSKKVAHKNKYKRYYFYISDYVSCHWPFTATPMSSLIWGENKFDIHHILVMTHVKINLIDNLLYKTLKITKISLLKLLKWTKYL